MKIRIPLTKTMGEGFGLNVQLFEPSFCKLGRQLLEDAQPKNHLLNKKDSNKREQLISEQLHEFAASFLPLPPQEIERQQKATQKYYDHKSSCKRCQKAESRNWATPKVINLGL